MSEKTSTKDLNTLKNLLTAGLTLEGKENILAKKVGIQTDNIKGVVKLFPKSSINYDSFKDIGSTIVDDLVREGAMNKGQASIRYPKGVNYINIGLNSPFSEQQQGKIGEYINQAKGK
jgi:hypothetical protein